MREALQELRSRGVVILVIWDDGRIVYQTNGHTVSVCSQQILPTVVPDIPKEKQGVPLSEESVEGWQSVEGRH